MLFDSILYGQLSGKEIRCGFSHSKIVVMLSKVFVLLTNLNRTWNIDAGAAVISFVAVKLYRVSCNDVDLCRLTADASYGSQCESLLTNEPTLIIIYAAKRLFVMLVPLICYVVLTARNCRFSPLSCYPSLFVLA